MEILIVGGGYIGMYTARRLERLLRRGEATVTVVDPRGYMTYQPFLAEAAGGSVEPRHNKCGFRLPKNAWYEVTMSKKPRLRKRSLRRRPKDCEVRRPERVLHGLATRTIYARRAHDPGWAA